MGHLIALTCEAMARSLYGLAAQTPHSVTVRLFRQGLHNTPKTLRGTLQAQIDAITPGECDAILLVYGMCGTSTVGLVARQTPLVIPRAHDCITLYLGSKDRFQREFEQHPGTYWYSVDYLERQSESNPVALGAVGIVDEEKQYAEFLAKYGEENAKMLIEEMRTWSQHYTRAAFIDTGFGDTARYEQMARDKAARENWVFELMQGNNRLLRMLVNGEWTDDEFLVVPPGHVIRQAYGDGLVRAEAL